MLLSGLGNGHKNTLGYAQNLAIVLHALGEEKAVGWPNRAVVLDARDHLALPRGMTGRDLLRAESGGGAGVRCPARRDQRADVDPQGYIIDGGHRSGLVPLRDVLKLN